MLYTPAQEQCKLFFNLSFFEYSLYILYIFFMFADFSNTFADFDKSTSFIPIRFIKLIQIFIKDRIKTILMF